MIKYTAFYNSDSDDLWVSGDNSIILLFWEIFMYSFENLAKIEKNYISHPSKCKCLKNISDSGCKKYLQYNDDISLH